MSKKFKVSICTGTTCYVLGGAHLMLLEDCLPADLRDQVEVVGSACLNECDKETSRPPYVKINDYMMESANVTKVLEYIRANQ
jgi:NADH:ubiquinone oxidoreductase subunit E